MRRESSVASKNFEQQHANLTSLLEKGQSSGWDSENKLENISGQFYDQGSDSHGTRKQIKTNVN